MYQKSNNCVVCKKSFGLIKGQKTCKFCGSSVCEECSPKKRANPKQKGQFVRICDICDEKYLRAFLAQNFKEQSLTLKEEQQNLEKENEKYNKILNEENEKLQVVEREHNLNKSQYEFEISKEENSLQKQKQKLDKVLKEIQEFEEETNKIRKQKQFNEENITDIIQKIQQTKYQLERTNFEIERISTKQKVTLDELTKTTQNVTSYQLNNRKGIDSILNTKIKGTAIRSRFGTKESTLTNQGYDDVFRSQNNNIDSVENYLIGLPSYCSQKDSFELNK